MIIELAYNNEIFSKVVKKKQDIKDVLNSMKPKELFTEIYLTVKEDGNNYERRFTLVQGKQLYSTDTTLLEILVNSINQFYGRQ